MARFSAQMMFALFVLNLFPNLSIAQTSVDALPRKIDFGGVGYGKESDPESVLVRVRHPQNEGSAKITDAKLRKDNVGFRIVKKSTVGVTLTPTSTPFEVEITFKANASGQFSDTLEITFEASGTSDTVTVPLVAQALCTSVLHQDCDPPGPLCRIDENTSYHTLGILPDYKQQITPVIIQHQRVHNTANRTYELPASYFWSMIGISHLVDKAPPVASPGIPYDCLSDECRDALLLPIKFTRVSGTRMLADFEWTAPKKKPTMKWTKPLPTGGSANIVVSLPDSIQGRAVVGPAYTEYHFRRKEHAPELTLSIDGNVLFSGHIHCYNTTLHYATIRSFEPGPGKSVGILVRDQ